MFGLNALQLAAFATVIGMLVLFIWGRWRYDLVAMFVLLVATLAGVVPADKAFTGFANPVIVIIASVLVVSRAIATSGILHSLMRTLMRRVTSPSMQIGILTACVTFLSAVVKNVGTLGIFMPIAIQVARRSKQSPSIYLMPLAFGSLIGGTITLIGTSPNLLVSSIRESLVGEPFRFLDFAWVGLPLSIVTVAFLMFGWRLLPVSRPASRQPHESFEIEKYTTELLIPEKSPLVGKRVGDLEQFGDANALVRAIEREGGHHYLPHHNWPLYAGDIVTIQADTADITALTEEGRLELIGAKELAEEAGVSDELSVVEAIVTADSPMIGQTPRSMSLRYFYGVNVLAVSRAGHNRHLRLQEHQFQVGDIVALQGWEKELPETLVKLGCLPLVDRKLVLGQHRRGLIPIAVLVVAMVLVSLQLIPAATGFFGAAVMIVLLRQLTLKEAYDAIEWPLIVMLGALIPVAEALKDTGAADVLGQWIAAVGVHAPGYLVLAMMLTVAILLTPLLANAAAVLVLAPVAAAVAKTLGYNTDPFLIAVALGCACDFLTPIGHQNNLLVMGPGGYKFTDYWRLGLPLSVLLVLLGTPLIMLVWPLQ